MRQLVERGFAHDAADAGHARVALQLAIALPLGAQLGVGEEVLFQNLVGVHHHGAELPGGKQLVPAPDAALPVENRSARAEAYSEHQQQKQRQKEQADCGSYQEVERALEQAWCRLRKSLLHFQAKNAAQVFC